MKQLAYPRLAAAADPVVERVARLGFLAKGLLATMIGGLALRLAFGSGGGLLGPEGALLQFFVQPYGRVTMLFMALGLWAHAAWKFVQALLDPEGKGRGVVAILERIAFAIAGLGYATLGVAAVQLVVHGALGEGTDIDEIVATVLSPAYGRWLVGVAGLVVGIAGVLQVRLGMIAGFRPILDLDSMDDWEERLLVWLGRAGYAALGIVSVVIGYFLVRVALTYDPELAGGWREALGWLAGLGRDRRPLGFVAFGIVCYGFFFILLVRYRRVHSLVR